jgi:hypothetical protein
VLIGNADDKERGNKRKIREGMCNSHSSSCVNNLKGNEEKEIEHKRDERIPAPNMGERIPTGGRRAQ